MLLVNLLPALSHMLLSGIRKGSEREGYFEIQGDDPLKPKGSKWAFHGDRYRCYP